MNPRARLYYDEKCPFCKRYSDFVKLRKKIDITLLNAREHACDLKAYKACDINEGMIIVDETGACFQGLEALRWIDGYLREDGTAVKLHHHFVSSHKVSSILYKLIKIIRLLLLKLLRVDTKI